MPRSRKTIYGNTDMTQASAALAAVDSEIYEVVDVEAAKDVAIKVGLDPRYVKGLKYREHSPSAEARVAFGFAYPKVGEVWAYWTRRMTEPTLFDLDEQRQFHRDYQRAGRSA